MKKIHRFIGKFDLSADRFLIRDAGIIHQIRSVLKLRPGEKVAFADGSGQEAIAEIKAADKVAVEAEVVERRAAAEPSRQVTLYCAVLKRDNFEYAVQKAVECGASLIVPLITARTVKLGTSAVRLSKIVQEAAEQSGRGKLPEVTAPLKFVAAVKGALANDENYFLDSSGEPWLGSRPLERAVGIWIGPEGGWEEFELEAVRVAGFRLVSLGDQVLRAETAATVAVYLASR